MARLRRFSTAWLMGLMLLLCLQQSMGLLHGHGDAEAMGQLFAGHDDDSAECRLLDQSCHFDAMLGLPALVLPLALAPFTFSVLVGLALARWHAQFQARGPPPLR